MITEPSATPVRTFQVDALPVRVYAHGQDLAADAAQTARQHLQATLETQGRATVLLATGNSQLRFLKNLTGLSGINWSRITLFHLDEYLGIAAEHPGSFRRYLRDRVLSQVSPQAFHFLEGDAHEPIAECERYTRLLQAQPIALCCLGIGENGHLAFNDPAVAHFNEPPTVKIVKLDLKCRQQQVREGYFPHLPAVPKYALTLTIPLLCSAKKMICVVPDTCKAPAVRDALRGPIATTCPASILRRQPQAILFLDLESASRL